MAGYTKEFLVDAFLHRYIHCKAITLEEFTRLETMANNFYDQAGRDKFRVYASLDASALRQYKKETA